VRIVSVTSNDPNFAVAVLADRLNPDPADGTHLHAPKEYADVYGAPQPRSVERASKRCESRTERRREGLDVARVHPQFARRKRRARGLHSDRDEEFVRCASPQFVEAALGVGDLVGQQANALLA